LLSGFYNASQKQFQNVRKHFFTLEEDNRRKLKIVSAITEHDMQDIVNEALTEWFVKYEKKNGKIPVR
jgi:hypothetical protein